MTTVAGSISSSSRRPRGRVRDNIRRFFGRSVSAGGLVTPATTVAPAVPQQSPNRIQDPAVGNATLTGLQIPASAPTSAVVPVSVSAPGTAHGSATLPVATVPVAAATPATPASGTAVVDASILGNQVTAAVIPYILITSSPTTSTPSLSITSNPAIGQVSAATSVPGHPAGVSTITSR